MNCDYYNNIYLIENFGVKSYPVGHKCKKNSDCASSFCSSKGKCKISNVKAQKAKEVAEKKKKKSNPIVTTIPIDDTLIDDTLIDDTPIPTDDTITDDTPTTDDNNTGTTNDDDDEEDDPDTEEEPRKKRKKKKGRKKKKKNKKNLPWIITVVIVCFLICLSIGIYFYMKYRKNNTQEIEKPL